MAEIMVDVTTLVTNLILEEERSPSENEGDGRGDTVEVEIPGGDSGEDGRDGRAEPEPDPEDDDPESDDQAPDMDEDHEVNLMQRTGQWQAITPMSMQIQGLLKSLNGLSVGEAHNEASALLRGYIHGALER